MVESINEDETGIKFSIYILTISYWSNKFFTIYSKWISVVVMRKLMTEFCRINRTYISKSLEIIAGIKTLFRKIKIKNTLF